MKQRLLKVVAAIAIVTVGGAYFYTSTGVSADAKTKESHTVQSESKGKILPSKHYNPTEATVTFLNELEYGDSIKKYSKEYDVDPLLVFAIMKQESGEYPYAKSQTGAFGLMQLTAEQAKELGVNRENDDENIKGGTILLHRLIEQTKSTELAIYAYNVGAGTVSNWIKEGYTPKSFPSKETRTFGTKVLQTYEEAINYNKPKAQH